MTSEVTTEAIGWFSNLLLLLTMGKQVVTQWKSGSTMGVSSWLFIGQLATSTGFVTYSWLLGNWVFVFSNALLIFVAIVGQYLYRRNLRREQRAASAGEGALTGRSPA